MYHSVGESIPVWYHHVYLLDELMAKATGTPCLEAERTAFIQQGADVLEPNWHLNCVQAISTWQWLYR